MLPEREDFVEADRFLLFIFWRLLAAVEVVVTRRLFFRFWSIQKSLSARASGEWMVYIRAIYALSLSLPWLLRLLASSKGSLTKQKQKRKFGCGEKCTVWVMYSTCELKLLIISPSFVCKKESKCLQFVIAWMLNMGVPVVKFESTQNKVQKPSNCYPVFVRCTIWTDINRVVTNIFSQRMDLDKSYQFHKNKKSKKMKKISGTWGRGRGGKQLCSQYIKFPEVHIEVLRVLFVAMVREIVHTLVALPRHVFGSLVDVRVQEH